jgi:hypothetical protein
MSARAVAYVCIESSRVGEMTTTPVPFFGLYFAR